MNGTSCVWRAGVLVAALALLSTLPAKADGAPHHVSTPTPLFTLSGNLRTYYFGRTNGDSCVTCKIKGSPNATAFNFGGSLHGQINIPHSSWALGATYMGADPFGLNSPGPLDNVGYNPTIDNTVPGYKLSALGEAYVQYRNAGTFGQTGKETLSAALSPWTNSADTRILPATYQGTLIETNPTPDLSVGAMYMARWKSRITSAFNANTLLTSCDTTYPTGKGPVAGAKGTFTVPGDFCGLQQTTSGFSQASLGYIFGKSGLVANGYFYQIYDIIDMTWVTAQYNFARQSHVNPFLAGQFLAENNAGRSLVGLVHNHTSGGLVGASFTQNLNLTVGYDGAPAMLYVVPSAACKGTLSSATAPAPGVIFGGTPNTSDKNVPKGYVACYGGGIASPYTDGYTSDPLYTTSLTQGMTEVAKPGTSVKATLTWLSNSRQLRLLASDAWFNYSVPGNIKGAGNGDARAEFDLDAWYYFSPVHPGKPYKGFSLRQRYGDRTFPFAPFEFKSSRTQLEYSWTTL